MIELPLVFIGGLLGSSHCIGMCGPFAVLIGSQTSSQWNHLYRQLSFSLGRIFTYASFGAVAGFGGLWLAARASRLVHVPATLSVVAGVLLIVQGAVATGWLRRILPSVGASSSGCSMAPFLAHFLRGRSPSYFLAGMFTGMLPCGLVYAFLALSASTSSMIWGGLTMAIFGFGTVPVMVITGFAGRFLSATVRRRVFLLAGCCLMVAGGISLVRGVHYLNQPDSSDCPYCATAQLPSAR